jgi:ATP-dependent Lhr-like helicase
MASAFELLHPGVKRKLWEMKWEELRPIQVNAIRHILGGGGDCVISSPTAGGKTEAAFLPVISAIADEPFGGVRAMYVGPLKALINDQFGRLEDLCARMELPVHKWHGDVGDAERRALISRPGGIMLITPESLEAMFVMRSERIPSIFGRLSFVVIDELHAFLGSPRGAQLRSLLHRLRVRAGCDPVRIGLSATIGNPEEALRWIRPAGPPATLIREEGSKPLKLAIRGIWRRNVEGAIDSGEKGPTDEAVAKEDPSVAELARAILVACRGATNLVFANAKGQIEELADELATQAKALALRDEIVVHHGSLAKTEREYTEARLREDRPCTAVCSNTLEMGIDIGQIDAVVQVAAPWTVSSLMQRVGRSGRHEGQARVLRGYFVEDEPVAEDGLWPRLHLELLQGIAIVELMLEKCLEPAELKRAHWSTLVQQLLSTLAETGGIKAVELKTRLLGSETFGAMSGADFAALLRNLAKEDLIEQIADGSLVLGLKGQRIVEHFTFFAAFRSPVEFRVIHGSAEIGKLPELTAPIPGDHLILAGKRWKVERVDPDRREIEVVPSKGRKKPKFTSLGADIDPAVHAKMRALLGSDARPSYLDGVAFEMLSAARKTAAPYRNFQPSILESGGHVKLFLWKGSKVQRTILLALVGAGLRVRDEEVGLEVDGSLEAVRTALGSFVSRLDEDRLAAVAEETMHARLLGGDKFDRYLPSPLWRRAFVAERLDIPVALAFLRDLLGPGEGGQTPILGPGGEAATFAPGLPPSAAPVHALALRPIVSLEWGEPTSPGPGFLHRGTIGEPRWGPKDLLRDLELRLGIPIVDHPSTVRAQLWGLRMEAHSEGAFYAQSYAVDRLGTAHAVLNLRDQLVDAGWNGEAIVGGGPRLETIHLLETMSHPDVPPGLVDRVLAVEKEMANAKASPYEEIRLSEEEALWSERWRRVFVSLRACGTRITVQGSLACPSTDPRGSSDLAKLQRALARSPTALDSGPRDSDGTIAGDGSVTILKAATSAEAAEIVAALVRSSAPDETAIVSGGDNAVLDGALSLQRLPTRGATGTSPWRPLLGVLPLALEMLFEPRDPLRVLSLLTIPGGPFSGPVGRSLSRALAAEPGVGGRRWQREVEKLRTPTNLGTTDEASETENATGRSRLEMIERDLARVAEWLEGPLHDPVLGAPKPVIFEVIDRVHAWVLGRLDRAVGSEKELRAAVRLAQTIRRAVAADARDLFPRDVIRQIGWDVRGVGHRHELWPEEADRLEHARSPAWLDQRVDTVVWWHFLDGLTEEVPPLPWREEETAALVAAGMTFVAPSQQRDARTRRWRENVFAAGRRLLFVIPERCEGEAAIPHPFLDDVMVGLNLDDRGLERITVKPREILRGAPVGGRVPLSADRVDQLPLPRARPIWQVDATLLSEATRVLSVTGIEVMLGCPLKWVLRYPARLRAASITDIPPTHRLAGQLGHRLIEELHGRSSAGPSAATLDTSVASEVLDRLIATEAAVFLRPGMSFERAQLRRDLLRAAEGLARFLAESGFRIVAVEEQASATWEGVGLTGRTDLFLSRPGEKLILDLKWGRSRYRKLLEDGRAVQLGAYAFMRSSIDDEVWPATGYFSLSRSVLLTAESGLASSVQPLMGPGPREVWATTSASLRAVRRLLDSGRLAVTGLRRSLPLLKEAGVDDPTGHLVLPPDAACEYCEYQPVCGRAWEGLSDGDG